MIYLLAYILLNTTFGLIIKQAQHRERRLLVVGAVNYIVAAAYCIVWALIANPPPLRMEVLVTGVCGGTVYVVSYFFLMVTVRYQGISVPSTVLRLSQIVPVIYAIAVWGERPTPWQAAGLVLFCGAMPLMASSSISLSGARPWQRALADLAGLFLVTALCGVAAKRFDGIGTEAERGLFLAVLFGTAGAIALGVMIRQGLIPSREELVLGTALGLSNAVSNSMLLLALGQLGGVLVFPVGTSSCILLTAVLAVVVWKEHLPRRARWGIAMAMAAVVFLNIRSP